MCVCVGGGGGGGGGGGIKRWSLLATLYHFSNGACYFSPLSDGHQNLKSTPCQDLSHNMC